MTGCAIDSKPIDKFLNALPPSGERRSESDGSWMVVCPAHEDNNPSLHVTEDQSGKLLLNCFKGCKAPAICYSVGLTISELFPDHGQSRSSSTSASRNKSKTYERLKGKKKVAEFDYRDADGVLVYQTVRYEDEKTGEKTFVQRRPNGKGGWIPNLRGIDVVLYRLPELIASPKVQPVFIVEGEKKVEALRNWGLTATCNTGGAGKWKKEYAKFFRNRDVYILPDNDPTDPKTGVNPGLDHARKIIATLTDTAKSVKILTLPDLPPKGDVNDWIASGGNLPRFMELIQELNADGESAAKKLEAERAAKDGQAKSAAGDPLALNKEEEILNLVRLEVLGEIVDSGGAIKVFSTDHRKTDVIKDAAKLTKQRLLQICGPIIKQVLQDDDSQEPVPNTCTLTQVQNAVALASGYRRIEPGGEMGRGVWRGLASNNEVNDSVILVGAGEAAKWENSNLGRMTKPWIEGRILDLGSSEPWYNFDELSELIKLAADSEFCDSALSEAKTLFDRWSWKIPESPTTVVGLILSTWIQSLWDWRPQVAIIGETNCGKSTFFKCLKEVFGALALCSSSSSAAGIRQKIGSSSPAVLCDEFDSTKGRQEILEMIRASSRGDTSLRGSANHKSHEFTMRHMIWTAGIESGLEAEPDRNRFITLELIPPSKENEGQLVLPPQGELRNLGKRLLAIAVCHALEAVELARVLKSVHVEGVHARVIESYAVPAAAIATSLRRDRDTAQSLLEMLLRTVARENKPQSDKDKLLEDILSSKVQAGKERLSISKAIAYRNDYSEGMAYRNAYESVGIGIFKDGLFISQRNVANHLLRGTQWEGKQIAELLRRFEGAAEKSRPISSRKQCRGILIPFKHTNLDIEDVSQDDGPGTEEPVNEDPQRTLFT